jgi:hypothetical protein
MLNIRNRIDDARCFETVRSRRRPDGVAGPHGGSSRLIPKRCDDTQPARRRSACSAWQRRFDDRTGTIFAGHHQPLRVGVLCLDFRGRNLSKEPIAHELDCNPDAAQKMTSQLRQGVVARPPEVTLSGEVECDEAETVAGHQGHPEAVKKAAAPADAGGSKGIVVAGRWPRRNRRSSA